MLKHPPSPLAEALAWGYLKRGWCCKLARNADRCGSCHDFDFVSQLEWGAKSTHTDRANGQVTIDILDDSSRQNDQLDRTVSSMQDLL
jgi:hypothetical protein